MGWSIVEAGEARRLEVIRPTISCENHMTQYSFPIPAVLVAVGLSWPHLAAAQTFKVERYSIGGDGGTDYLTAEARTRRVFVSRGNHVMVIDGRTGKGFGEIPGTPPTHRHALAPKSNHR